MSGSESKSDSESKNELLGRLAVERGYVTPEQLEQARAARQTAEEMAGVRIALAQVLLNKQFLTKEQLQELKESEPDLADAAEETEAAAVGEDAAGELERELEAEAAPEAAAAEAETEAAPEAAAAEAEIGIWPEGAEVELEEVEAEEAARLREQIDALKAELREKNDSIAELRSIAEHAEAAETDVARYRVEAEQIKAQFSLKDQLIRQLLDEEKEHKELAKEHTGLAEQMENLMLKAAEAEALKAELKRAQQQAERAGKIAHQLSVFRRRVAEMVALKAELEDVRPKAARAEKLERHIRQLQARLKSALAGPQAVQTPHEAPKAAAVAAPPSAPKRKVWSPSEIEELFGRLAAERGYLTHEQFDEARRAKKRAKNATGIDIDVAQILTSRNVLTRDQVQDLKNAVAVRTGELRLVAGYEVVSKLGRGGMGAVYKARRLDTGGFVALKILLPSLATKEHIARFRRESEIVRTLDHQNIVSCVEFGYDKKKNWYFCALEFVEGENLDDVVVREGALPEDEAISITSQVAMGLQHAFTNGLIHRDVKPANIMVTPDGTAKLLDLGLARPADMEVTRLTTSGMFVGSPHFASPEQAKSSRKMDIRSDIYSLGATLYYVITGKPPFDGETALTILEQHVSQTLTWPADLNPEVSDGLCLVVTKMMAKDPDDRYQTPKDVVRSFDELSEGREPELSEKLMRTSSIRPALRPRRRRQRPPSRARDRREPARPGSEGGRRRSSRADNIVIPDSLPTVPVAIAVAFLLAMLVAALVAAFSG